ncbi:MAG TPA: hypothetical protein VI282_20040 [Verrucomicrobiae bacterium]|jgi:hypothetical protein
MANKKGLDLKRVVLLGRTLEEYRRFFGLDLEALRGKTVLDVASGVSSFTAEMGALRFDATAFDRIYAASAEEIRARCEPDLEEVTRDIATKPVYRWDFYKSAEGMREFRVRAYKTFLKDFTRNRERYVEGELPRTPFHDRQFYLTLASYLLFVYEDQLSYEFHKETLRELMRVTTGEIRIYPIVTFEAEPSKYLQRIRKEPEFRNWEFEVVPTDFEFLRNSNCYLRLRREEAGARHQ